MNKIATSMLAMVASVVLISCDEAVTQVGGGGSPGGGSSGGLPNPGPRWTSSPKGEHCVKITSGDSGDFMENICSEVVTVVVCAVNARNATIPALPTRTLRYSCGESPSRLNPYYGTLLIYKLTRHGVTPARPVFEYHYAACIGRTLDFSLDFSEIWTYSFDDDELGLVSNSQGDYACYVLK